MIEFLKKLEDLEVTEGSKVDLNIEVSSETAKVMWQKDGQSIQKDDQRFQLITEGKRHSLFIKNATVHHDGEYTVSVGEQECSCELTVVGKKHE